MADNINLKIIIKFITVLMTIMILLFAFYGFSIKASPVAIINSIIVFINIYYLYKLYNKN